MKKGNKVKHNTTDEIGIISRISQLNNTIVWVIYKGFNYEYPQPIRNITKYERNDS